MITAQIFTFYIIKCESLSGDLFHINSILIDYFVTNELRSVSKCELIVDSLEQMRADRRFFGAKKNDGNRLATSRSRIISKN